MRLDWKWTGQTLMLDLNDFFASKFHSADTSVSENSISIEDLASKSSFMIIGDKLDLKLLKAELDKAIDRRKNDIFIIELDLDAASDLAKTKSSVLSSLKNEYYLIFTSNSYLRLVEVCGIETLRSYFHQIYLAKVKNASIRYKFNNNYQIGCIFQRPIIDWAYKTMLEGQKSRACSVLLLYLELFGPRDLSFLDRMRYISIQDRTLLPSGDIASILNSGARIDISWFFYKDAVTQEMERENSKLELPFWDMQGSPGKKIVFRRVHSPTDEILYASIFKDLIEDGMDFLVEADKRLVDLFSRSFPEVEVVPRLEQRSSPSFVRERYWAPS